MIVNGIVMFYLWSSFFILSDIVGVLLLQYCINNVVEEGINMFVKCKKRQSSIKNCIDEK